MRTPNKNLTTREEQARDAYEKLTRKLGEPPTVRAFGAALKIGPSAAQYLLNKLREKGALSAPKITIIRSRVTAKGRRAG